MAMERTRKMILLLMPGQHHKLEESSSSVLLLFLISMLVLSFESARLHNLLVSFEKFISVLSSAVVLVVVSSILPMLVCIVSSFIRNQGHKFDLTPIGVLAQLHIFKLRARGWFVEAINQRKETGRQFDYISMSCRNENFP